MERKITEENQSGSVETGGRQVSEQKLIEAAQNGDQKAFGQLIRIHQKKLFRFIASLTSSFDQADDIVQEAFVRAWKNIKKFRLGYDFYPWLSTIARNLAYNELARQEKEQSLDSLKEQGFDPVETEFDPMGQLLDEESQKRFYEALWSMPAIYRSVFVLRHFEEMDYAEIGSYLKIPPGTVNSRLHRARQYLMEKLKDLL